VTTRAEEGFGRAARLVHPFPSAMDATVTAALAAIAGAGLGRVALLAAAMLALQFSIGAWNDTLDADADRAAGRETKPVARGLVSRRAATRVAIGLGIAGLGMAAVAGLAPLGVAVAGYACGVMYDIALKRTAWSWLPYAVGIPLIPVFAWVGSTGRLPGALLVLVGMAIPAGAALAISNALGDAALDARGGVETVAGLLGPRRAMTIVAAFDGAVAIVALATSLAAGGGRGAIIALAGSGVLASGILLAATGRPTRGWEAQAIGLAIIATGWALANSDAGLLA